MKAVAYRIASGAKLAPFDDAIGDVPLANEALSVHQERAASKAGLQLQDVSAGDDIPLGGPAFFDDTFLSADVLRTMAQAPVGSIALVPDSAFTRTTGALQGCVEVDGGRLYDVFNLPAGKLEDLGRDDLAAQLRSSGQHFLLDPLEKVVELPVLEHYYGADKLEISFTSRPIIRVRHWLHLLQANQLAMGLRWREFSQFRLALWGAWAMLRGFSLNKHNIMSHMNTIGPGCDIHPSAVIEGSVIGPGCTIGPHARVRFSNLGSGVVMQACSQADFAVLGDRALVSQNCAVNFSVIYPEACASHYLVQLCVLGRRAITVGGSFLLDTHFGPTVKVVLEGAIEDSGERFLGAALGHGVRVGSGVWIPAGREIPNGAIIVRSPDDTASKIAADLPAGVPLVTSGGKIVPW